jgi:hypothetical protein
MCKINHPHLDNNMLSPIVKLLVSVCLHASTHFKALTEYLVVQH